MYNCTDDNGVEKLEWDARKEQANRRKHRVAFIDAAHVLFDMRGVTETQDEAGETRFVTVGTDNLDRTLVVVWTQRGKRIRIISARQATSRERADYEWMR